jgi:hypothetical protein
MHEEQCNKGDELLNNSRLVRAVAVTTLVIINSCVAEHTYIHYIGLSRSTEGAF